MLGVNEDFVRNVLFMRIPILHDEFVQQAIINQVGGISCWMRADVVVD